MRKKPNQKTNKWFLIGGAAVSLKFAGAPARDDTDPSICQIPIR
jgi:hypothetical protein